MAARHTEQKYLKATQHYGDKPVGRRYGSWRMLLRRRHMRLLLQMQEAKWLIWQSPGRTASRPASPAQKPERLLLSEKAEQLLECLVMLMSAIQRNWVK